MVLSGLIEKKWEFDYEVEVGVPANSDPLIIVKRGKSGVVEAIPKG